MVHRVRDRMLMTVAMAGEEPGEMARQTKNTNERPTHLLTYSPIVHYILHTHFLWKEGSGELGERIRSPAK